MTKISLVVSDVDGTLLTKDKTLTERARSAVRRLHQAGIGFTITSSRPAIGMRFLIEPLALWLPVGPFNGSSIVDPEMKPVEQHLIPASAAERSLQILREFGADIWLFTTDQWLIDNPSGKYVAHEQHTIRSAPTIVTDFTPYLSSACKIVGASADAAGLERCERVMQEALGSQATAVRSQTYYLDVTPPGHDKGTFVDAMIRRLGIGWKSLRRHLVPRRRGVVGNSRVPAHAELRGTVAARGGHRQRLRLFHFSPGRSRGHGR